MLFSKKLYFSIQMLFFLLFIQKTLKTEYIISTVYILVFIKKFFFLLFWTFQEILYCLNNIFNSKNFFLVWILPVYSNLR